MVLARAADANRDLTTRPPIRTVMLAGPFHRARRIARRQRGSLAAIYCSSLAAGVLLVVLIWLLGLTTHLLATGSDASSAVATNAVNTNAVASNAAHRAPLGWSWVRGKTAHGDAAARLDAARNQLLKLVGCGLLAAAAYCVAKAIERAVVRSVAARVACELRSDIQRHARKAGTEELTGRHQRGSRELFRDNVETVRQGLLAWWDTVPRAATQLPLLAGWGLLLQFWTVVAAILVVCLDWLLLLWLARRARRQAALAGDRAQRAIDELDEGLGQSRRLAAGLRDEVGGESFASRLDRLRRGLIAAESADGYFESGLRFTLLATTAGLLGLIGLNVLASPPRAGVSEAVMLSALLACSYRPVHDLLNLRAALRRGERAARPLFVYLETETGVRNKDGAPRLRPFVDQVEFDQVAVADRAGRRILGGVSFKIPARCRVAVVSSDREAPLALASLAARLYDPAQGRLLFDGKDARTVALDSVRGQVALVLQEGLLQTASVQDNVADGDPRAGAAEVLEVLKKVQAREFAQRLPQGVATVVGPHGLHLDPGEALQLGLARAMLRDPRLVIIEESPVEPDPAVAEALEAVQARWSEHRALLVIAYRLATLRHAKQVLLLDAGQLVAQGSHAELLKTCELYRHLHYLRYNLFGRHDH